MLDILNRYSIVYVVFVHPQSTIGAFYTSSGGDWSVDALTEEYPKAEIHVSAGEAYVFLAGSMPGEVKALDTVCGSFLY